MKKIGSILKGFKADWNNHLVGFVSTIFGILIAFQLQDWQEKRNEDKRVKSCLESIKLEVKENQDILHNSIETLKLFNGYTGFIVEHLHTDSTIICSQTQWDSLKNIYDGRNDYGNNLFTEDKIRKKLSGNKIEIEYAINISFFIPKLHTASWETVKASGLLTSIPYDKLVTLTRLYEELNRNNAGSTPDDFMIFARNHSDKGVKQLNQITRNIEFDYTVKTWRLGESFGQIMNY